jgi:hypothetical protein
MQHATSATALNIAPRLLNHWQATLPQLEVNHEPYDHTYLEGFFPADLYREIQDNLPEPSNYQPLNAKRWSRSDGESTRDILTLTDEGIAHLPDQQRQFWSELGEVLSSSFLKRFYFETLKQDVALRLGITEDEAIDFPAYISTLVIRDTDQYRIKPHPDGFPRLVTLVLYLPTDSSREDLGTSVYVAEPWYRRVLGQRFREVDRFPYRPNSAAAFAVNNLPHRKSLHGRELVEVENCVRNLMIVTWFSEPPEQEKSEKLFVQPVHDRLGVPDEFHSPRKAA